MDGREREIFPLSLYNAGGNEASQLDSEYQSRKSKSCCLENSAHFISDEDEYENLVRKMLVEDCDPSHIFWETVISEMAIDALKRRFHSDEQKAFLFAVENGDTETVKSYFSAKGVNVEVLYRRARITDNREHISEQIERLTDTKTVKPYFSVKRSNTEVVYRRVPITDLQEHNSEQIKRLTEAPSSKGLKARFTSKDCITDSLWLEAVTIAHRKRHVDVLNLLFKDDRFYHEFNDNGQNILYQAMEDYLAVKCYSRKAEIIDILLKPYKSRANVLNLQNETVMEIFCKVKPSSTRTVNVQIDPIQIKAKRMNLKFQISRLLEIILQNGVDLSDRKNAGKTLLMLACENERIDIVRGLLDLTLYEFHLDIDAVDNSGETALMKAKRNNDLQIVAALLRFKFMSAVENENVDVIKCMLKEFRNISEIFVKSWNSEAYRDEPVEEEENKFEIWRDAMYIAMEKVTKRSEEILKLLLDCGILSSLEAELGYPILHRLIRHRPKFDDKILRLIGMQVKSEKNVNCSGEEWKAALQQAEEEAVASLRIPHDALANKKDRGWTTKIHADKIIRLIEMLLKSGKINVNATDEDGETVLHLAEDRTLASLLIRYGADVNKKDKGGTTPLLMACMNGYDVSVLQTILEEAKEAGTFVDLDATDCNGRTALMIAAKENRPDVVELLLNAGASVTLSDHLGLTALHHALFGDIGNHDEFPRNSEELKKRKEITILFDAAQPDGHRRRFGRNENRNERLMKIAHMLLRRSDVDVNALSFEKFSPLDIAEGWIPEIPSSIKDALKKKGAVLNVFEETESQSANKFYLDVRCKLTVHRFFTGGISFQAKGDFGKERLLHLIETFKKQIVSGKDQQGRTALHLAAISFSTVFAEMRSSNKVLPGRKVANSIVEAAHSMEYSANITDFCRRKPLNYVDDLQHDSQYPMALKVVNGYRMYLAKTILKKLISLGYSVNETDVFGRTPLHYANESLKDLLECHGADASIKDKDGRCAFYETSRSDDDRRSPASASDIVKALYNRHEENHLLRLINYRRIELNVQYSPAQDRTSEEKRGKLSPKLLWKEGKYAFRHPLVKQITEEVTNLMSTVAKEIERLDPRFEIRTVLPVGSSNEATKIEKPDEFDFCFVLTKISELCEVSQSPELPPGFVRLKQKLEKIGGATKNEFGGLFREDGILDTDKLNWQFVTILNNAVVNIESRQNIEWNLEFAESGIDTMFTIKSTADMCYELNRASNIKMTKTLNFISVNTISIDVVACIHIDGWWPDEAISNVSDDIKTIGCNLIVDRPQSLYPWVPYSKSYARMSFAKAESDTIRQSCDNARQAYMIGKTMIEKSSSSSRYILKNCLLYCIEALTPTSEKASKLGLSLEEMKSRFHQMDRYLWLKCLLKCHLQFVAQDFCPCYFLPTGMSPIRKQYLKQSSVKWVTDDDYEFPDLCKKAYAFYRFASEDISESCCQLPAPHPLWENFDRNQLTASLYEIAFKKF